MGLSGFGNTRHHFALAVLLTVVSLQLFPVVTYAQNLGQQPATGQAVQGQTAAQPEGTVLNLVNWVGNVISPVGAALAVVMAVVAYSQGHCGSITNNTETTWNCSTFVSGTPFSLVTKPLIVGPPTI